MPAEVSDFDTYDSRILAELQRDARITMAELGRRVHLSQPAVTERVRKLEMSGVIKGYRCSQAPCKLSLLTKKGMRAICRGATGDFGPLPEAGPVTVTLGAAGSTYCGSCGGTAKGKVTKVFKRKGCAAPTACP